jgi:peptidoglycan hydrolase-like protein with peptidoglycan-binding domain
MMARPSKRLIATLAGAVALVAAVATAGFVVHSNPGSTRAADTTRLATTQVIRGTLEQTESATGYLGYGVPIIIKGQSGGVITWLPAVGHTIARGHQIFRVNDAPITLFYGDMPLYRSLSGPDYVDPTAQTGHDVSIVAANLAALGFYRGTKAHARFDGSLVRAVKAWQRSLGRAPTGEISPSSVRVAGGSLRVAGLAAQPGDDASENVLSATTTTRIITLNVPNGTDGAVQLGDAVNMTLADGTKVSGAVSSIGAPASSDQQQAGSEPTVPVTVDVPAQTALVNVPLGPITADIVLASKKGVTYVPIAALLALSGGGYALQRPNGTLVAVTLGMVTDGDVEVSGIDAGTAVVIAR